jgi:cell division septation protein DedD
MRLWKRVAARKNKRKTLPDSPHEAQRVKNGWLVIALLCSFMAMAALIVLDLRLLRDPSVAVQLFGSTQKDNPKNTNFSKKTDAKALETEASRLTPEVTFYTKLSSQSDPALQPTPEKGDGASDRDPGDTTIQNRSLSRDKDRLPDPAGRPRAATNTDQSTSFERTLPDPERGSPLYTVQVGAFTHPGIAQEWAAKWKTRGYDVVLKPVARPKTGVIYRLYLGSFASEKTAEDLVKHLKSKEGISAFTLVLRN